MKNLNKTPLTPLVRGEQNSHFPLTRGIKGVSAFTLVELIIVITILAILATIAFISFQNFTKDARDGNRVATLKNIEKGLDLYAIQNGTYPMPDTPKNISYSGAENILTYQGIFGATASNVINMNKPPVDPKDETSYIYAVSASKKGYKLLTYLENQTTASLFPQTYAVDYTKRFMEVYGRGPAILIHSTTKEPITTDVDLKTDTTEYTMIIDKTYQQTGSGTTIAGTFQTLAKSGHQGFGAPTNCPSGFIPVPGKPEFGQPGFCVAKYEMKWDGNGTISDNTNMYCGSVNFYTDNSCLSGNPGIISKAEGKPLTRINQPDAIQLCNNLGAGYHLITNNEWMTIARNIESNTQNWSGTVLNSGHNDNNPENSLAASIDDNDGYNGTGNSSGNQKRTHTLSNGQVIWDLAGNVWEHVNKANTLDGTGYATGINPSLCPTTARNQWSNCTDKTFGPSNGTWTSTQGVGQVYQATGTIFLRGGAWDNTTRAGVFSLTLLYDASSAFTGLGFRCAFSVN